VQAGSVGYQAGSANDLKKKAAIFQQQPPGGISATNVKHCTCLHSSLTKTGSLKNLYEKNRNTRLNITSAKEALMYLNEIG
jgi:hypothetical protein